LRYHTEAKSAQNRPGHGKTASIDHLRAQARFVRWSLSRFRWTANGGRGGEAPIPVSLVSIANYPTGGSKFYDRRHHSSSDPHRRRNHSRPLRKHYRPHEACRHLSRIAQEESRSFRTTGSRG